MEVEDRRKKSTAARIADKPFFKKIKSVKNIQFIACVFILAIALLLYSAVATARDKNAEVATVGGSTNVKSSAADTEEARLADILSQIDGAGDVSVMISYGAENKVEGVLVVASGAKDMKVKLALVRAVQTALNVNGNSVEVFSK